MVSKTNRLFQGAIFRFHVKVWGCNSLMQELLGSYQVPSNSGTFGIQVIPLTLLLFGSFYFISFANTGQIVESQLMPINTKNSNGQRRSKHSQGKETLLNHIISYVVYFIHIATYCHCIQPNLQVCSCGCWMFPSFRNNPTCMMHASYPLF